MVALAMRITVEIFRVLSQDSEKISAKTLINYYNQTELIPYSINSLMELFEIYSSDNLVDHDLSSFEEANQGSKMGSMMLCAGGSS